MAICRSLSLDARKPHWYFEPLYSNSNALDGRSAHSAGSGSAVKIISNSLEFRCHIAVNRSGRHILLSDLINSSPSNNTNPTEELPHGLTMAARFIGGPIELIDALGLLFRKSASFFWNEAIDARLGPLTLLLAIPVYRHPLFRPTRIPKLEWYVNRIIPIGTAPKEVVTQTPPSSSGDPGRRGPLISISSGLCREGRI